MNTKWASWPAKNSFIASVQYNTELLKTFKVHVRAPYSDLPMECLRVSLFLLCQHHDRPDPVIVVVKNHALFCIQYSFPTFCFFHWPGEVLILPLSLQISILFSHLLNFCVRREVAHVVDDTATKRVCIVAHHLVQEAAQIISLRVPVAVLKVD